MIRRALHITYKDCTLILLRSSGIVQSILLGMLVIFVFSLAQNVGDTISPQVASTLFCLSTVFCQILICNALFALEDHEGIKITLLLAPMPIQAIALGKFLAGFFLLVSTQILLLPSCLIFLSQTISNYTLLFLGIFFLDCGVLAVGTLLGAIGQNSSSKDSLLTVLAFPLLLPLLLATIRIIEGAFTLAPTGTMQWALIACSFSMLFMASLIALFPFLYSYK